MKLPSCSETRLGILRGSESTLDLSRVIQLSHSPKLFLYDGFLSMAECDYLTLIVRSRCPTPPLAHCEHNREGRKAPSTFAPLSLTSVRKLSRKGSPQCTPYSYCQVFPLSPLRLPLCPSLPPLPCPSQARSKLDPPNKKPLGNSMFIRKYQVRPGQHQELTRFQGFPTLSQYRTAAHPLACRGLLGLAPDWLKVGSTCHCPPLLLLPSPLF